MSEFLRAFPVRVINTVAADDPSKPVRFVVSTEGRKRDGMDLRVGDWDLSRYADHSIVLWAHDAKGERHLPIGSARVSFDGTDMVADILYDEDDEFAQKVRAKAVKGLVAASVFWVPVRGQGTKRNQLVEISNIPVPLDPKTLAVRGHAAMRSFIDELDKMLDDDDTEGGGSPEATWEQVAGRMARLFAPGADDDDAARPGEYKALLPSYRRAGKEPPEFRLTEDLTVLAPELRRGLFVSGELEIHEISAMFEGDEESTLETQVAELSAGMDLIKAALGIGGESERSMDEATPEELNALSALARSFETEED